MSKHYLAPLIIAVGISSCSEIGDKLRGDEKAANISSVEEHSDSASPPVSVAGSFLHCNIPSFHTEKDASHLIYDCGLKRDEEYIVLPADSKINFQMLSQDKEVVLNNIEHTVPAPGTFRFAVKLDLENATYIRANVQLSTSETDQFDYELTKGSLKFHLGSTLDWNIVGDTKAFPAAGKLCGQKIVSLQDKIFKPTFIIIPEGHYRLKVFAPELCSRNMNNVYFHLSGEALAEGTLTSNLNDFANLRDSRKNDLIFDVEIQGGKLSIGVKSKRKKTIAFKSLQFELINLD